MSAEMSILRRRWFPYLLGVLVVAPIITGVVYHDCAERGVRLFGLLLQTAGFFTVAYGLDKARRLFGKESWWRDTFRRVRRRVGSLFRRRGKTVHGAVNMRGLVGLSAVGEASVRPGAGTPLEQRFAALQREVDALTDRVRKVDKKVTQEADKVRQELKAEAEKLQEAVRKTQAQLDEAVVGGIHIEWVGLGLFLVGLWLATASPEITSVVLGVDPSCAPLGLR